MLTSSRSNKNQPASVYSREDYAAVNGWDGAVGTISDTAVFGSSFTLSMTSGRRNNAQTASDSVAVSGDGLQGGGAVGVFGRNASVVNGSSLANNNIARIPLAVSSGAVAAALNELKFTGTNVSDPIVVTDSASMNYSNYGLTAGVGTADTRVDGLSFTNGGYLGFEILKEGGPRNFTQGYRLNGITFDVTFPIPEPSSVFFTGIGVLGTLVHRR